MAVRRKRPTGLATNIMCVLRLEGQAKVPFFASRFRVAPTTAERTLDALERRGLVKWSTAFGTGGYTLTGKGQTAAYRSKACGMVAKRHADYVSMRGASLGLNIWPFKKKKRKLRVGEKRIMWIPGQGTAPGRNVLAGARRKRRRR